jgi:hypothetical protein
MIERVWDNVPEKRGNFDSVVSLISAELGVAAPSFPAPSEVLVFELVASTNLVDSLENRVGCIAPSQSGVWVGDKLGNISLYNSDEPVTHIQAHKGNVYFLTTVGGRLVSVGKDGAIRIYMYESDLKSQKFRRRSRVRRDTFVPHAGEKMTSFLMLGNELLIGDADGLGEFIIFKIFFQSHFKKPPL